MDWIYSIEEKLAAMTEEEILSLGDGREYLGNRCTVCLGSLSATFPPNMHDTLARRIEGWGVIFSGARARAWK